MDMASNFLEKVLYIVLFSIFYLKEIYLFRLLVITSAFSGVHN